VILDRSKTVIAEIYKMSLKIIRGIAQGIIVIKGISFHPCGLIYMMTFAKKFSVQYSNML